MKEKLIFLFCMGALFTAGSAFSEIGVYFGGTFTGTVWHDTIYAPLNSNVDVPVYFDFSSEPTAYVADVHLPLGVNDTYIDSIPLSLCSFDFYPFNAWDDASFLNRFESSPPNQPGYHSRSFLGFSDLGGQSNPWLHYTSITQGLNFKIHIRNNPSWIGTTVSALRDGVSSTLSGPALGDTIGGPGYVCATYYAYLHFTAGSSVDNNNPAPPREFSVAQNYPNPFNAKTTISFILPVAANVTVTIYDIGGKLIQTIDGGYMEAGKQSVVWDASKIVSGVYYYKVTAGDFSQTMKATLQK
jgi:hypothetical protein